MNTLTQQWIDGTLLDTPKTKKLIVTPEPNCNLACDHCYFAHNKVKIGADNTDWSKCINFALIEDIPIFCAGRIITPRVIRFCEEYLQTANARLKPSRLSLIDNGFTIFNAEHLFDKVEIFNISIDGRDQEHDIQRRKKGAARVAWNAVYKLKGLGYDPILSSCMSPITMVGWSDFEKEVYDADVPISTTLTFAIENTRSNTLFKDNNSRKKALEILINGVPKLIQLYDTRDLKMFKEIVGEVRWEADDSIPGLRTTLSNGTSVAYRPTSLLWVVESLVHHDGKMINHTRETKSTFEQTLQEEREVCGFV